MRQPRLKGWRRGPLGLALLLVPIAITPVQAAPPAVAATAPPAAASRPFSADDLVQFRRISDPQVAPGGREVAFTLRSTDLNANAGRLDLWLMRSDGTGLTRLTSAEAADQSPRWSPDGKTLWFLSTRSGSSQVWRIDPRGGEAVQVSRLPVDVNELLVAPDGRLLLVLDTYPDCPDLDCTVRRDEEKKKQPATGRLYDRIFVRHWDTWKDGKRSHLFLWAPDGSTPPRDLLAGLDGDCPSKPWGGVEEVAFAPDGRTLFYTIRLAGREEPWSVDFNVYRVGLTDTAPATCLTCDNRAWDTQPTVSPDGKTLAWLAMERPGYEADRFRIKLLELASGKMRTLTEAWDRSPASLLWAPDGRRLFTVADNLGQRSLFAIDVASGKVETVVRDGNCGAPVWAGDRLLFALDTLTAPADFWTVRPDGRELRQVTAVNEAMLKQVRLGQPEQFTFTGAHGHTVYAYLVRPADFDPARRYPVAFLIHGGPQGSFGNHFHYRWNPQTYAGAGYAAVMVDFHGSTGYGQAFTDAIRGDWGGAPYEDLMKGLDAAAAKYPFLDLTRTCALGASYGGFMVNWIAGQTDRFRCLVTHDGNLDERMAYFNTEELWFPEWDHQGTPWDNPAGFAKHNPIDHVGKWKTPMLVVHGGRDFRVVETQGLSTFNVLQRRGIPSKFLHFPDENHWVLKPQNSIRWHRVVLDWLGEWTK